MKLVSLQIGNAQLRHAHDHRIRRQMFVRSWHLLTQRVSMVELRIRALGY